jgi:signal transduction histidine kinase
MTIKRAILMLLLVVLSHTATVAQTAVVSELEQARQETAHYKKEAKTLKIVLVALTGVYIFVYIMGRRRLTRMIFVRNRAIRMALKKAEDSDRRKSEFIRDISYQVRTPLNAISGFSQLLSGSEFDLSPKDKDEIKRQINQNVDAITAMIEKLHDMANQDTTEPET